MAANDHAGLLAAVPCNDIGAIWYYPAAHFPEKNAKKNSHLLRRKFFSES
jgi:hypothetical protein